MPILDPNLYTVAWIAPLEIEVQAARHMLDKVHSGGFPVGPGDDYLFHAGEICGHNVVIATFAASQQYGTNSATSLASHVFRTSHAPLRAIFDWAMFLSLILLLAEIIQQLYLTNWEAEGKHRL
ncbi:hypothetical protein BDW66DRAFT_150682 [Aspergillus desertorum]